VILGAGAPIRIGGLDLMAPGASVADCTVGFVPPQVVHDGSFGGKLVIGAVGLITCGLSFSLQRTRIVRRVFGRGAKL
jgi:hypothetical protein